ncbi:SDR family oxidoreductase [Terrabacter sp. BE26]|uniref:SDR family oxidoreductase n=1 Tax=Terrabacter sp. BE26 TaxID=2898152 RepID=UPI0035BEA499
MSDQTTPQDPSEQYDQPEGDESIEHPGLTKDMDEQPDHGEQSYQGFGRLSGKRAVITGGDSGIGRAVAIAFAREGADVLIACLPDEKEDAEETRRLVEDAGRRGVVCLTDLTQEEECNRVVDEAVEQLGGLDILVNNAAYQMAQPGGLEDITTEQLDRVMKTNLYAMFWLTRRALPHLGKGATIINTSSIQSRQPSPELLDYATTKAGIVAFTQGLAQSVAERGIRVNAVAPGPVWTPLIPATMPEGKVEGFGEQTPLGRAGQPAELAPAYVFLASQESSYITGEVIGVTGGQPLT